MTTIFLLLVVLLAQQPGEELGVAWMQLFGTLELPVEHLEHLAQLQVLEKLLQVVMVRLGS